jgi:NosR/NirI family nitrous oxide reductase transcriptional regulator
VGHSRPDEGVVGVDAISGATVTVIAQNQVMTTSGSAVARQVGIIKAHCSASSAICAECSGG